MVNEPRLYVVDLSTGEVTGGPEPGMVQHYDRETGGLLAHAYAPDECDRCAEIRELADATAEWLSDFSPTGTQRTPAPCPFSLSPKHHLDQV